MSILRLAFGKANKAALCLPSVEFQKEGPLRYAGYTTVMEARYEWKEICG